jgi:hypothetical protein
MMPKKTTRTVEQIRAERAEVWKEAGRLRRGIAQAPAAIMAARDEAERKLLKREQRDICARIRGLDNRAARLEAELIEATRAGQAG